MATAIDATTGLTNDHVNVGFAVGKLAKDGYLFDNLRIRGNSISAESMEQEFIYDVFGRRVAKTTYDNYIAKTTYYAYDGDRVVEELDGNGKVVASYVYGNYIDEVVEMWRDADGDEAIDPAERFYYLQDDMYNVVALADHEGDIVERYAYGDYGAPTVYDAGNIETGNESAYGNPYLFNGREWDADTGLYWYRTRYMDPELGRFISRDTIGLWGDENNLGNPYAFVGNNPWSRLDPYGLHNFAMANPATMSPEQVRQYHEAQRQMVKGVYNSIAGAIVATWNLGTTLYEQTKNPERHRREVQDGLSVLGDIFRADDSQCGASAGGMMLTHAEAGVSNYIGRIQNDSATVSGEWLGDWLLGGAFTKGLKYLDGVGDVGRILDRVEGAPTQGIYVNSVPDNPYFIRIDPLNSGRPDPRFSIDSHAFSKGEVTSKGGIRNAQEFWEQWQVLRPESLSKSNRYLIENFERLKVSPRIDDDWISVFPEHAPFRDDVLIHHHVDFGRFAIPVPKETHVGSGGIWHTK